MSAIVKTISAAFAASVLFAAGASAQEMKSDFFSGMTSPETSERQEGEELISTIEKMMADVRKMQLKTLDEGTVTIEEIDQRNREAQRLRNDLSLRELKYKEMQSQIDMLLLLDAARREVLESNKAEQESVATSGDDAGADGTTSEAQSVTAAESEAEAAARIEQMAIPRVAEIYGSSGQYGAKIQSVTGVTQEVKPGSLLVNGFRVKDITLDGVVITGDVTGRSYFVAPAAPAQSSQPQEPTEQPAIDMSGVGVPQFF